MKPAKLNWRSACVFWIMWLHWLWHSKTTLKDPKRDFKLSQDRSQVPWVMEYDLWDKRHRGRDYFRISYYDDSIRYETDTVYPDHPRAEHRIKNLKQIGERDVSIWRALYRVSPIQDEHVMWVLVVLACVPAVAVVGIPVYLLAMYVPVYQIMVFGLLWLLSLVVSFGVLNWRDILRHYL